METALAIFKNLMRILRSDELSEEQKQRHVEGMLDRGSLKQYLWDEQGMPLVMCFLNGIVFVRQEWMTTILAEIDSLRKMELLPAFPVVVDRDEIVDGDSKYCSISFFGWLTLERELATRLIQKHLAD